jgi:hypothetical protein
VAREGPCLRLGSGLVYSRACVPAVVSLLLLGGCGDRDEPATTETPPAAETPESYRAQVSDCVEEVGFVTRDAGNALRVESPGGSLISNIQTFPSRSRAQGFAADVAVAHAYGGRGVAVWLRDADDTERRVVADCLTP